MVMPYTSCHETHGTALISRQIKKRPQIDVLSLIRKAVDQQIMAGMFGTALCLVRCVVAAMCWSSLLRKAVH